MRTAQVRMRMRSRPGRPATDDGLSTSPGKWRVLSIVLSARVAPRQAERVYVALRCVRQREAIGAGWPVFSRYSGSVALGLIPLAPSAAMSTRADALTDQLAPLRLNAIGADSAPRNLPIRPDKADMGPPAAPLAMAVMASRCSTLARSSVTRPTDQLPFPISSGVNPRTMKPRPSSDRLP